MAGESFRALDFQPANCDLFFPFVYETIRDWRLPVYDRKCVLSKYLIHNSKAGYRFLPGGPPYSSGVIADDQREIIHCRLHAAMPWAKGMSFIREFVESKGLSRQAICGIELRCPEPHSIDGFGSFNDQYIQLLSEWDMLVDGHNPIARTNVAPVIAPPTETMLHGFSYIVESDSSGTFVVSGGGELPHRSLERDRIVRVGETSADALLEKVQCVVRIMQIRLSRLEANVSRVSHVNAYCRHDIGAAFISEIVPMIPNALKLGVNWHLAMPPVRELEFEMDIDGVIRREVV